MDFDVILLSSGLPNLLPQTDRTEGCHVSAIITDMCLKRRYYSEEQEINWTLVEMGKTFEWALIQRYLLDSPDDYMEIGEVCLDGVYMHPDLLMTKLEKVKEIKWTFRSSFPGCEIGQSPTIDHPIVKLQSKFWKDRVQLMAYCRYFEWTDGELEIGYHRGNYRDRQLDHAIWGFKFTKRQLIDNWDMLLRHRDSFACVECGRFKHEKHNVKCSKWTPENERWRWDA